MKNKNSIEIYIDFLKLQKGIIAFRFNLFVLNRRKEAW